MTWPAPPRPAAFHGLAGEIVEALDPYTESAPVAVLAQTLAIAGCMFGAKAHFMVGTTRHAARINIGLVGATSGGRKGTSVNDAKAIPRQAEPFFFERRVVSGIASGEAVIHQVRDATEIFDQKTGKMLVTDPGISDKRLLVVEPEFARLLGSMSRQGNITSAVLREAWDGGRLMVTAKSAAAASATGAHISVIVHITAEELRQKLDSTDIANGFANRFLWILAKRSKPLPEPDPLPDAVVSELSRRFDRVLQSADRAGPMKRSQRARECWISHYEQLTRDRPGLAGAMLARAEAQVLRLSMIYARLDGVELIDLDHLEAALALWDYSERSVNHIFGTKTGDAIADTILNNLEESPSMTRTDISNVLGRDVPAQRIDQALDLLVQLGHIEKAAERTGGRGRPKGIYSINSFNSSLSPTSLTRHRGNEINEINGTHEMKASVVCNEENEINRKISGVLHAPFIEAFDSLTDDDYPTDLAELAEVGI